MSIESSTRETYPRNENDQFVNECAVVCQNVFAARRALNSLVDNANGLLEQGKTGLQETIEKGRDAEREVMDSCRPYILHLAKKYPSHKEDTEQAGYMGLVKAVLTYDSQKGNFLPYARSCIGWSITDEFRYGKCTNTLITGIRNFTKLRRGWEHLVQTLEREPTEKELVSHTGVSERDARLFLDSLTLMPVDSLEEAKRSNGKGYEKLSWDERIAGKRQKMPEEVLVMREDLTELEEYIDDLDVSSRDKAIFLLYCRSGKSLKDVGKMFDMSEGRTCQIVNTIRNILKERFYVEDETV